MLNKKHNLLIFVIYLLTDALNISTQYLAVNFTEIS